MTFARGSDHRLPSYTPAGGASLRPAWSEVSAFGEGRYRIRLGGFLGPQWLSNLCRGMAEHRLSIDSAHAVRTRNQWLIEFVVIALDGSSDPYDVPYVELAASPEAQETKTLALTCYGLERTSDHGGTLRLTLEAPDALGLLGALLSQLAAVALFPVEMHVATRQGRAHDCLWLAGRDGQEPSPEAEQALRALLDAAARR